MIIAFMGNDGSGKTTISRQIHKFFTDIGFETTYKHEHEYVILRFLFELVGEKKIGKSRNEMLDQKKRSASYVLWPILVWFDLLVQYLYYRIFKRRSVIVLDRYPYDQYLSFKYLGILTRFTEWLYLHFPKADVNLILTVSPDLAYERKKGTHSYSVHFYEKQTEEYLNLARILEIPVINTNDDLRRTVSRVITTLLHSTQVSNKILKKANQNRVIFQRFNEYELVNKDNRIEQDLWKDYEYRLELLRQSLHCIHRIVDGSGVSNYVLIKTIDDFHFIGNDIDVLVSPSDFKKVMFEIMRNFDSYDIREIKYDQTKDVGKMDVFPKGGLKLDIHSYIGWGNLIYFEFKELFQYTESGKLFDINCKILNSQINSFVIATHGFEKGYLTLDEYKFIQKNFDKHYLYIQFPHLSEPLEEFFRRLELLIKHPPQEYPIFFPLSTFARCYLKLLSKNGQIWKLHLFVRDLSIVIFWKCRYRVKNKLPFEVKLFGIPHTDRIDEDNQI